MKNEKRLIYTLSKRLVRVPFLLSFILLPSLIFGLYKFVTTLNPKQQATYEELMVSSGIKKSDLKADPYQVKQNRSQVQKDILFTENESRMQLRLTADDSKMVLDHREDQTEIVEHMNKVVCHMQEELYFILPNGDEAVFFKTGELVLRNQDPTNKASYISKDLEGLKPMQIVRLLIADEGTYHYKSDLFYAENVKLQRFIMEGHAFKNELPKEKMIMSGIADTVEFSLDGKNMNFKANKLKATLYDSTAYKVAK